MEYVTKFLNLSFGQYLRFGSLKKDILTLKFKENRTKTKVLTFLLKELNSNPLKT